jgi:Ca2+-binding RTX toxin-like protein
LFGGGDRDFLFGGSGNDTLQGGDGDDFLEGGEGADTLDGGDGIDSINYHGSDSAVTINLQEQTASGGDASGDVLISIELARGSHFDDMMIGSDGDNFMCGLGGDDAMYGGAGNDILRGAEDGDHMDGGTGIDTATYWSSDAGVQVNLETGTGTGGHAQGDTLVSIEIVQGSSFDDVVDAAATGSTIYGYDGNDRLTGHDGEDLLVGGIGNDTLDGEAGIDLLFGDDGDDWVFGGGGDDFITAGAGDDVITGDTGADTFKFRAGDGNDIITDFKGHLDMIVFSDGQTTWRDITTEQQGSNVIVQYGDDDMITVMNANVNDVWDAFDFY